MNRKKKEMNLKWMASRLRVMRPAEIFHRVGSGCALKIIQAQHKIGARPIPESYDPSRFEFCAGDEPKLPPLAWSFDPGPEEVEALLSGRGPALGRDWVWRPDGSPWHTAPDTGLRWPKLFFGLIPYRPGNPYGDVRFSWEPSRLQQLVVLGLLAKRADGRIAARAVSLLEREFLSWVDANPPLTGIHYISAMECGLRILAACHAVDLIRGKMRRPETMWRALLSLVDGHARMIAIRLSKYSSAGNHTIGEAAGLVYAGILFPEMRGAKKWKETGRALLEEEATRQILKDGGGAEQAFRYHHFILDLYGLALALLEDRKQAVSKPMQEAFRRGKRFLSRLVDHPEELFSVGDADNGYALGPFLRLAFDPPREGEGGGVAAMTSFEQTGYTLLREKSDPPFSLLFDHGPLGMPPLYGHGHADALSVLLRLGGEELLIDPGTYQYNGDPAWRRYFRGTSAHNTVTVDGEDQAVQEGTFIWSHPYQSGLAHREATPDGGVRLLAFHDGYGRLGGVTHWRGVVYHRSGFFLIWDYLTGPGNHRFDLHWHLGVNPVEREGKYLLQGRKGCASLSVEGGETALLRGETGEICGWRSRLYGVKEPIASLRTRFKGRGPHEFVTRIWIGDEPETVFSPSDELYEISLFMGWVEKETAEHPITAKGAFDKRNFGGSASGERASLSFRLR